MNALIDYIEDLIDYIVLESFPIFWKNTLIDSNNNLIDYIVLESFPDLGRTL